MTETADIKIESVFSTIDSEFQPINEQSATVQKTNSPNQVLPHKVHYRDCINDIRFTEFCVTKPKLMRILLNVAQQNTQQKNEALDALRDDVEQHFGIAFTSAQVKKKLENLRFRLKIKLDNKKPMRLCEKQFYNMIKQRKKTHIIEISEEEKEEEAEANGNVPLHGDPLFVPAMNNAVQLPHWMLPPAAVADGQLPGPASPRVQPPIDDAANLATDELQRLVLLEQLASFSEQRKMFEMQRELLQIQMDVNKLKKLKLETELWGAQENQHH